MTSPVKIWRNQKSVTRLIGRAGKILSWTIIRVPPEGFSNQAPYPVALVKLEDGEKIIAQMVDYNKSPLKAGGKVVCVLRRVTEPEGEDLVQYGIKIKPV